MSVEWRLLAVFGTPLNPADDHPRRTFAAALGLSAALERFNVDQLRRGEPRIGIGIGVTTGSVLAGNVGSDERLEYTLIGDAVNVASRLRAMTRELDATIPVADGTARAIADRHALEELGPLPARGKREPVIVYAVRRRRRVEVDGPLGRSAAVNDGALALNAGSVNSATRRQGGGRP